MKLGKDVLLAIMAALRKGIMENTDISDLLQELDVVVGSDGTLVLNPAQTDVWTHKPI